MNNPNALASLRHLAAVDRILSAPALKPLVERFGRGPCKAAVKTLQQGWRSTGVAPPWADDPAAYAGPLTDQLAPIGYQSVFNLTGTLIHTNLGRAPLSARALAAATPALTGAVNLEFDLAAGARGQRDRSVADRIARLTGAPAVTLVNNCAAALVLTLNTLALGREVPVSRGELIEIGGSFRLPDIMRQAGCELVEVGTTNRTRVGDFAAAITDRTATLLKVHPSNYEIRGFAEPIPLDQLAALGRKHDLPVCEDLGSGALIDLSRFGLPAEPRPQQSLERGADLVMFSGDKLLGGPQAGIIVGRSDLIDRLNRNPLKRALRLDKLALTVLDETLKLYEDPDSLARELPILRLFSVEAHTLDQRASALRDRLQCLSHPPFGYQLDVQPTECQVGSGAQPGTRLPSVALRLRPPPGGSCDALLSTLRRLPVPVIGRVQQDAVWLDMRGAENIDAIATSLDALPGLLSQ